MQALGGPRKHSAGRSLPIPEITRKLHNIMINFESAHVSIALKSRPPVCKVLFRALRMTLAIHYEYLKLLNSHFPHLLIAVAA